uniref:Uncharacterized protein n=1 Tax=Panagrolaimus sp. PS1159 TaxID=55785 RepID=A0AC35GVQ3_9BILA
MFSSSNHHQNYQQKEEQHLYGRYNRKINKEKQVNFATSNNVDSEKRLETILKGLEDRVQIGKDNLYKLQYQRSDLEFELKSLQDEKMILDGSLLEAKKDETFVREKERQINKEFMELATKNRGNGRVNPEPFITRTLIIGQELFSSLLRDVTIEETARMAFEAQVSRIQIETAAKEVERNKLQERILILQTDCDVDLEQQQIIYDEINVLQKRSHSLDAQILMLMEWRKSLINQILAVYAAIKQRQTHVFDSSSSFPSPPESPSLFSWKPAEKNVDFESVWHQIDDFLPAVEKDKTDSTLSTSFVSASSLSLSTSNRDISSSDSSTTFYSTLSSAYSQESLSSPSFEQMMDNLVLSPAESVLKNRFTKELAAETKLASKTDICKEYKIVAAAKEGKEDDPNAYQMELNAIYIILFAVFLLLIYRFICIEDV